MRVIAGTGWHQESQTLAAGTWTEVFPANHQRSWISIQNTGSRPVYLYIGDPTGMAVDGTVGFHCLKASCSPYSKFVMGDMDAVCKGPVWALAVGAGGSTIQAAEF